MAQCVQWIAVREGGCRQCRCQATHRLPGKPEVAVCTQHARSYDVPIPAPRKAA